MTACVCKCLLRHYLQIDFPLQGTGSQPHRVLAMTFQGYFYTEYNDGEGVG